MRMNSKEGMTTAKIRRKKVFIVDIMVKAGRRKSPGGSGQLHWTMRREKGRGAREVAGPRDQENSTAQIGNGWVI